MIAILSIDFDYFIAANAQERDEYFLRGGESIPREELLHCGQRGMPAIRRSVPWM